MTSVTLTEQGTYGGGSFNLSNYEYQGQWNTVETLSQSNDWGDGYTGTNQGAAYNGGGDSGDGWQETQQSSGSLTEQGTYSGGGFSLTVSYQGSGQETFSGSASGSDSWGGSGDGGGDGGESPGLGLDGGGDGGSGGSGSAPYTGTDSFIASESAVGSYTVSAAGNYDGGSFSLGNYNFQGSSQGTYQQQEGDAETLYGAPSTYAHTESITEQVSVAQTGQTVSGAYQDGSYGYTDTESDQGTDAAYRVGFQGTDQSSELREDTVTGSGADGSEVQTASMTDAWSVNGQQEGSGSASNMLGTMPALPGPVVTLMAPDATTLPVASAVGSGGVAGLPTQTASSGAVLGALQSWMVGTSQLAWNLSGQAVQRMALQAAAPGVRRGRWAWRRCRCSSRALRSRKGRRVARAWLRERGSRWVACRSKWLPSGRAWFPGCSAVRRRGCCRGGQSCPWGRSSSTALWPRES